MKKKKLWIFSSVAIIVLVAVGIYFYKSRGAEADGMIDGEMGVLVQKVGNKELSDSIVVTGEIIPEDEQKVFLNGESGDIKEFKVAENDKVKAGDVLFTYDTSKLDNEFGKATRERELIQSRYNTEKKQVDEMVKQVSELKRAGAEPVEVQELEKQKVELELQLENTKSEIQTAQEAINDVERERKEMVVVSKIDGTVVQVNKNVEKTEEGSNEPAVHVVSSEPFKVIGTMSEFDTVKMKKDLKVIIRPKVFKDEEWNGVVESISQFPSEGGGGEDMGGGGNVTMYPFKVKITDDTSKLRQGFHVTLEVLLSNSDKTLVVPQSAILQDEEEGSSYVFVLADGKLEQRNVETGASDDEFISIKEGVNKDELVVIMPDDLMHDGMEVKEYDEVEGD